MKTEKKWWKEGIIYQIYPRSFKDTSGDGLGDIEGIIEKLDYIRSLGVNIIWLCPIYESPNHDNGYDISDYRKISNDFGGNASFDRLISEMQSRNLKLIMDLVVNHSSDQHQWFKKAKQSKENPYHDYYIWKHGSPKKPPNNWQSVFNGSVWEWNPKTEEYFLHLYTKNQPDLNWENPKVRNEVYEIIEFWINKGVNGFRMDVISLISKRKKFKDIPENTPFQEVMEKIYANGPRVHEFLKEMNQKVLSKFDIVTVGEGPGINLENGSKYVSSSEKELNMIFHFDHLTIDFGKNGKYDPIPLDFLRFKEIFRKWDKSLGEDGWNSIFLGNHDFSRMVSRFGNDNKHRNASAKLLITLLMTLRGTPYLYQGDEIGMTNVNYSSINLYDDVESINAWKAAEMEGKDMNQFLKAVHKQSRDNARTPMQWNANSQAGFTRGNPWIPINDNYTSINVEESEKDPNSILNYYRKIISFRKSHSTLIYGSFKDLLPDHSRLYVYERTDDKNCFLITHNFSDLSTKWQVEKNSFSLKLSNYKNAHSDLLLPWETRIYQMINCEKN